MVAPLSGLARVELDRDPGAAKLLFEQALSLEERHHKREGELAALHYWLAKAELALGDKKSAREFAEVAREFYLKGDFGSELAEVDAWLAKL